MANFDVHPLAPGEGVPLFIAAGVIKEVGQLEPFFNIIDPLLAPVITLGSYTVTRWSGNATIQDPIDYIHYPDRGMAGNARNLPNEGIEGMRTMEQPIRRLSELGIKTIISVTNLPHERPIDVIPGLVEAAAELNPTAIEINLSCPNGRKADGTLHAPLCNDADASGEVLFESRLRVGQDVVMGAKDSPHVTSLDSMIDVRAIRGLVRVAAPLIDFLTGINTIGNQPFPEITANGGRGGMSGPVVKDIAKKHLQICKDLAPDLAYLSCGGVETLNAAQEIKQRLAMGALLVGGAQQAYRLNPAKVMQQWAQAYLFA